MYALTENGTTRSLEHHELNRLRRWRISTFWVMLLGYVGYYMVRANLPAAFPLMTEAFSYSKTQLGAIAATSELAYAAGKFINGPLADKVGGRRIFLLGMAGAIFFNILFAMSSTIAMFTLIWCACRYFLSMGWGGLTKVIGNWYPPEKNGTVMGLISVNFQFGGVAATLFAGYLVTLGSDWQGLFLYPALVVTAVWIWSYFCSRQHPSDVIPGVKAVSAVNRSKQLADFGDENNTSVKNIIMTLIKMPIFRHLLVFSFLTTLLRSFFFFWTPQLFSDIGMKHDAAIFRSALFPFLGCVGTILLGWYTDNKVRNGDRARPMWIMLLGLCASMIGLSILMAQESLQIGWIVALTGSAGFFLLGPYSMSSGCLTLDIAGSRGAGSCTGFIDGLGYIGGAMAAWGSGYLADRLGWPQVFQFLLVFALLSTLSAYLMSREFRRAK